MNTCCDASVLCRSAAAPILVLEACTTAAIVTRYVLRAGTDGKPSGDHDDREIGTDFSYSSPHHGAHRAGSDRTRAIGDRGAHGDGSRRRNMRVSVTHRVGQCLRYRKRDVLVLQISGAAARSELDDGTTQQHDALRSRAPTVMQLAD
jgi:hypothetical protein